MKSAISEYMTKDPLTIAQDAWIAEAIDLMKSNRIRHLPVVAGDRLVGLISDRDAAVAANLPDAVLTTVKEVMVKNTYAVTPDTPLGAVVLKMADSKFGSVVVKDAAGKPIGIFTSIDALRVLAKLVS